MSKGKDPKGPVRQGSRRNWSALISGWSNAKRNPHAIIGTHQNAHTTHPTVGEKSWDTFAFKHTGKAGEEKHCKETVAIKSYARKEFNCVLDGGHATTFSERPTSREIAWTPTKQFRVRYFRNGETTRPFSKERTGPSQGNFHQGYRNDRNPNAPSHEDLHQQRTNM